jgi:thiol-disulfide isomerase/thioredoxin
VISRIQSITAGVCVLMAAQALFGAGPAISVEFFITTDCPISNSYAPEIQRICAEYGPKGVSCELVYVDPTLTKADVEKHVKDFGYSSVPTVLDATQKLVKAAGATITPEAAILGPAGAVLYRGRIDNVYAALGKRRPEATEHDLRKALDEVLSGKAVSEPRTQAIGCYIPSIGVKR